MPTNNKVDYVPQQYSTLSGAANGNINNISPGSSGDVLTSNGASQPTYQTPVVKSAQVTLTNAQLKAFTSVNANDVQLIAAPGSGKTILPFTSLAILNYGGNNAFTTSGALQFYYGGSTSQVNTTNTGFMIAGDITATANQYHALSLFQLLIIRATSTLQNQPININITTGNTITGNAANDNTITVFLYYIVMPI